MSAAIPRQRPIVLAVLDGWGHREGLAPDDAIRNAMTPTLDALFGSCPSALLQASEGHVGLPDGQMGNSEVGHLNLGAGRVVMQDLPRIDRAIADGSLGRSEALLRFAESIKCARGRVHLLGLVSDGGVHAHQDHLLALAKLLAAQGLEILVHAFLDGRDTPPRSASAHLARFERGIAGIARFATIGGRYYAMDRDKRWERVALAYDSMVDGTGERATDWRAALDAANARGESDEFVRPTTLAAYDGMRDGDAILFAHFRADRARQILHALLDPDFHGFRRMRAVGFSAALGLVEYAAALNRFMGSIFMPIGMKDGLGELVARAGLKQLRIAETEKYAHVTFFFDGGEEREHRGAERIMVPSPQVATYDLKPEMSAPEVTDRLVDAIESGRFDFVLVNYANTDMVGHTGDYEAARKAVETVDRCLARVVAAVRKMGGALVITADHGNAEMMREPSTGEPHTAHTTNPVPILLFDAKAAERNTTARLADGKLADVAPTVLELLGLERPEAMTGRSLLRYVEPTARQSHA
jgi:2,3-bisphosphoglycerate-independent phosphoglycerate mutase